MIEAETLKTRREELGKTHDTLVQQLQQLSGTLERIRGAIALCDELLASQNGEVLVPEVQP
jgi:hypothetical protein